MHRSPCRRLGWLPLPARTPPLGVPCCGGRFPAPLPGLAPCCRHPFPASPGRGTAQPGRDVPSSPWWPGTRGRMNLKSNMLGQPQNGGPWIPMRSFLPGWVAQGGVSARGKDGNTSPQHPGMLQAPRGAPRPFPKGLPSFSTWLCSGCPASPVRKATPSSAPICLLNALPYCTSVCLLPEQPPSTGCCNRGLALETGV